MKKVICIALALLLLAALTVPVLAVSGSVSLGASASTLYRGDTFSVTANLSTSDAIALGTVTLRYDTDALELTGGECHVSGASIGQVIASQKVGTFLLSGDPRTVSGKIFTFYFKVKDGAAFGSYTISSNASIGVESGQGISSGSTTVTVACRHAYANCTSADADNHVSTCTVCGDQKTEAHTWNAGTVTKEATCKDTGIRALTCTGCGAGKDEIIPVTEGHQFGAWSDNGTDHIHTCTLCGKSQTADHTWNNGTVITAATCQSAGSKHQRCTGCDAQQTVSIPVAAHDYAAAVYQDENGHKLTCKQCGQEETQAHHYSESWLHDENWHFLRCEGCGHEKEQAAHIPGPEATQTTDQICTVCARILQPRGEHEHNFSQDWSSDATGHWHACDACNEKDSAAPHVFDNDCDSACNVCQAEREPAHQAVAQWSSDAAGHWHACQLCGEKLDATAHVPGPEATITAPQTCTVCLFEIAPAVPHEHVFYADGNRHSHSCACGAIYEATAEECQICETFPWQIVCIAEALVFGMVIVLILFRKRRR